MFALDGFDEEGYEVDMPDGAGVAFPQSDDEDDENSTDGERLEMVGREGSCVKLSCTIFQCHIRAFHVV